jgi:hypothetical protein
MKKIVFIILFSVSSVCLAWNSVGHRLVAQIAYDNLKPEVKRYVNRLNHALDVVYKPQSFVNAASWMDQLKSQGIFTYDPWHYIDIPFSEDDSALPLIDTVNAAWVIEQSLSVLTGKNSSSFDKGFHLRVLTHVVGDLHQPLHAAEKISAKYPDGDKGGNLFYLKPSQEGNNLHAYWDNGAGLFNAKNTRYTNQKIRQMALQIQKQYPRKSMALGGEDIAKWAKQSHKLAKKQAYKIEENSKPSSAYRNKAREAAKQQIALAGYRLAYLLNNLQTSR